MFPGRMLEGLREVLPAQAADKLNGTLLQCNLALTQNAPFTVDYRPRRPTTQPAMKVKGNTVATGNLNVGGNIVIGGRTSLVDDSGDSIIPLPTLDRFKLTGDMAAGSASALSLITGETYRVFDFLDQWPIAQIGNYGLSDSLPTGQRAVLAMLRQEWHIASLNGDITGSASGSAVTADTIQTITIDSIPGLQSNETATAGSTILAMYNSLNAGWIGILLGPCPTMS